MVPPSIFLLGSSLYVLQQAGHPLFTFSFSSLQSSPYNGFSNKFRKGFCRSIQPNPWNQFCFVPPSPPINIRICLGFLLTLSIAGPFFDEALVCFQTTRYVYLITSVISFRMPITQFPFEIFIILVRCPLSFFPLPLLLISYHTH